MKKYDQFVPYYTTVDSINMSEEETIGSLDRNDVVTLLKEIQKAMTLQYYKKVYTWGQKSPGAGYNLLVSPGGQLTTDGDQWKFTVVHSDGEYGVYKLGITQLIDAGIIGKELTDWVNNNLQNIPVPSKGNEEYESWYGNYVKYNSDQQVRIIEAPVSQRNNALYYMLTHIINGPNDKFNVPVHSFLRGDVQNGNVLDPIDMHYGFIMQPWFQDLAASNLLKFTYQLLLTSRALTPDVDKKTLAGVLALAICFNIDAAQNYLRGTIKSDENGISAKYWFDVGFNAVALPTEKVATPGPTPNTTSVVKDEEVTPPVEQPAPVPGETSVETAKTSNSPVSSKEIPSKISKTITNGAITYELTSAGTISAKVITGVKPKTTKPPAGSVSNPYYYVQRGIKITAEYLRDSYSIRIVDRLDDNRDLFVATDSNYQVLQSRAVEKLQQVSKTERDSLHGRDRFGTWLLAIDTAIEWLTQKYAETSKSQVELKQVEDNSTTDDAESNKTIAFDDPADIETLVKQLDIKKQEADKAGYAYISQACASAKAEIINNFTTDTQSISNAVSQSTQTSADGSNTKSVSTVLPSGAVKTVTTTTNADGTVAQQKTIEKVETPLKEKPQSTLTNGIDHPAQSGDASKTVVNAEEADKLPVNENTNVSKQEGKGFKDPNKKYPRVDYTNKPDTNTLALGVNSRNINPDPRTPQGDKSSQSLGSSPAARNASRKRGIKMAGRSGATWEQPVTPYAAQYPYNKVFAGESGHALEIDDTPGFERINIAHRSGTFSETGPDGTQVNRIVGNGYSILEKDGFVLIEGNANVHIAGQCNVFIMNDTALTMHGKVSLDIHNDVNVNIGGSLGLSVQDGIYLRNEGDISIKNEGKIDSEVTGAITTKTNGKYNLTTDAGLNFTSKVNTHIKSFGAFFNHSTGDMNFCTDAELLARSTGDINIKTDAIINQESGADFNIKSAGALNQESVGNLSLTAPLVASSPIDTPTLDVSTANITTLNAGTTNLTGTHNSPDDTRNIKGNTTATITAPIAAASAADAVCAVPANLPVTYDLEPPVTLSAPRPIERANSSVKTGYDGENDSMNTDGGEPDENGVVQDQASGATDDPCLSNADPSNPDGPGSDENTAGGTDSYPAVAGRSSIPSKDCNMLKGTKLPPLPKEGQKYDGTLRLSPRVTLAMLCNGRDGCPNGWSDLRGHRSPGSKQNEYEILNNLRCLAVNVIEPLLDKYGSVTWSCAFRKYYPNGKKNKLDPNAHGWGSAVDLSFPKLNKNQYIDVCRWAASNLSAYDQIILEKNAKGSVWVHIGYVGRNGKSRGQQLTATPISGGKMKYSSGFRQVA